MTEIVTGDRVALINEGSTFTDAGSLVAEGETGTVIGHRGFSDLVVLWTSGAGVVSSSVVRRVDKTRG